jgi:squalene-associated FAD-dependent desaturase
MSDVPDTPASARLPAGDRPRVVVVGGGLAGLAAAAALADSGCGAVVLEARRRAGGRAASFEDPVAGGLVDACQHVAMGCCTNFLDLCRQAGIEPAFRRDRTLWFIGPDNRRSACTPSRLLPAPLHLLPLLLGMTHFSWPEKLRLAAGMLRLARWRPDRDADRPTAAAWLRKAGQPARVIELFWQPVIESALGESIELVDVAAARKVAVDAFLAHRRAADLLVPRESLGELVGERLTGWLRHRGVVVEEAAAATSLDRSPTGEVVAVRTARGSEPCSAVILALPWRAAAKLAADVVPAADERFVGSPITAVHLWFDRDCIDLPHAVLVGRVSQWVFRPEDAPPGYCQVVISGSRGLLDGDRTRLRDAVVDEVRAAFPEARAARLVDARIVTDPTAVLSVRPGVDAIRPRARTTAGNLFLAGDWTATGWPSTMEGAVRSGRAAAAAAAELLGVRSPALTPDLPRSLLVRLLIGSRP